MAFQQQLFGPLQFSTANTTASQTSILTMNGSYLYIYIRVPTMTVGFSAASTPIYLQASSDGVTFSRFTNTESNTTTVGANDFAIQSSVSSRWICVPNFAFPYLKVEISGTVSNPTAITAAGFQFMAVSNQ